MANSYDIDLKFLRVLFEEQFLDQYRWININHIFSYLDYVGYVALNVILNIQDPH